MADKDTWLTAGSFLLGTLLVTGGVALAGSFELGLVPVVLVSMTGFVVLGLGVTFGFRWQTGALPRRRVVEFVLTSVGIGVAMNSWLYLDGTAHSVGIGLGLLFALVIWYWQLQLRTEQAIGLRDERTALISYKAGWRTWQFLVYAIVGVSAVHQFYGYDPGVESIVIGLLGINIVSFLSFNRYYSRKH